MAKVQDYTILQEHRKGRSNAMGLTNDERTSLVELRLDKAKRFLNEASRMKKNP